jgi:hypothetical protein
MVASATALKSQPPTSPARWLFDTDLQAASSSNKIPSAYRNSRSD